MLDNEISYGLKSIEEQNSSMFFETDFPVLELDPWGLLILHCFPTKNKMDDSSETVLPFLSTTLSTNKIKGLDEYNLGLLAKVKGNWKSSINFFQKSLSNFTEDNKRGKMFVFYNLGTIAINLSNYKVAKTFFFTSCELAQLQKNYKLEIQCLIHLSEINRIQGNLKQADIFLERSFRILNIAKNKGQKADALLCYAKNKQVKKGWDEAKLHLWKSLKLFSKIGNNVKIIDVLNELSFTFLQEKKLEQALHFSKKALFESRKFSYMLGEANAIQNLGIFNLKKMNFVEAKDDFEKSLRIFKKLEDMVGQNSVLHNLNKLKKARMLAEP